MRKLFLILVTTLAFTFLSHSSYSQMVQLASMNGEEICQGFMPENQALLQIVGNLPIPPGEDTYITYFWRSVHEKGSKTWDTSRPDRRVPIPWTGEYTVQVQVMYTRHGSTRPYAVFWSNPVKIMGTSCKP